MYRILYLSFSLAGLLLVAACNRKDTVQRSLSITGFSPTAGLAHTLVTIQGSGFDPDATKDVVSFNGVKASIIQVSDTALVVEAPDKGSTGPLRVNVGGWQLTAGTYSFQSLSLRSASPLNGPEGTNIRISGVGFASKDTPAVITIGGLSAAITSASDTLLIAAVPHNAVTGAIQVQVGGQTALGPVFLVQRINAILPANGGPGTVDTIRGKGFGKSNGALTVAFNGIPAQISSINDSVIIAAVPASVTTGPVSITMNGQQTVGPVFAIVPVPVITSVSPLSGPAGTPVIITGKNFSSSLAANRVNFNGVPAIVQSAGSTKLLVSAPAGAKSGLIGLSTNGQVTQGPVYTYQTLNITGISPDNGLNGTSVTISGNGFGNTPGAVQVYFNGKPATVTSVAAGTIVVTVPTGVTTGQVNVQVNGVTAAGPVFRRAGVTTLFSQAGSYFSGIAIGPDGYIYVTNPYKNNILRISPDGSSSSVFAGSPAGVAGFQGGNGTSALFNGPGPLVFDGAGNLYVADENNVAIRQITPAGAVSNWLTNVPAIYNSIELAATGNSIYMGIDNGLHYGSGLFNISSGTMVTLVSSKVYAAALASDAAGNLYFANNNNGNSSVPTVSEWTAGGVQIPVFAGGFNQIGCLAVDPTTGNILVGDVASATLYSVTPDGANKATVVGAGSGSSIDGNLQQASFTSITNMTTDSKGAIYVIDNNNQIRKVTLQ